MTSPSVQSSAFIIIDPGTTEPVEIFYDLIESCLQATPIFVRAKSIANAQQLLDRFPSIGFYVSGSQEVKPGIADYDYRELLEYLDAD